MNKWKIIVHDPDTPGDPDLYVDCEIIEMQGSWIKFRSNDGTVIMTSLPYYAFFTPKKIGS